MKSKRSRRYTWAILSLAIPVLASGCGVVKVIKPQAAEPTTLTNLGFEDRADPSGRPTGWRPSGNPTANAYRLEVDPEVKRSGAASGRITYVGPEDQVAIAEDGGSWNAYVQCTGAKAFVGTTIRYTGFLKTSDVTGPGGREQTGAGLWFRVDGPGEETLSFDNMDGRRIAGTTDWERHEITLEVPTSSIQVCFGLILNGHGTAWGDDLTVRKLR